MKAIQTRYAGCHFRSRLEARWAVFFDTVGIRWEYEHQGYMCPYELTPEREGEFPYLPDFWLPELGMFAEVKGSTESGDLWKVMHSAAHFSRNGKSTLFLGHIPQPGRFRVPYRLWSGSPKNLFGSPWVMDWTLSFFPGRSWVIFDGWKIPHFSEDEVWGMLLEMASPVGPFQFWNEGLRQDWFHAVADSQMRFEQGYEEARSARF